MNLKSTQQNPQEERVKGRVRSCTSLHSHKTKTSNQAASKNVIKKFCDCTLSPRHTAPPDTTPGRKPREETTKKKNTKFFHGTQASTCLRPQDTPGRGSSPRKNTQKTENTQKKSKETQRARRTPPTAVVLPTRSYPRWQHSFRTVLAVVNKIKEIGNDEKRKKRENTAKRMHTRQVRMVYTKMQRLVPRSHRRPPRLSPGRGAARAAPLTRENMRPSDAAVENLHRAPV